jgi:hypothetical protein
VRGEGGARWAVVGRWRLLGGRPAMERAALLRVLGGLVVAWWFVGAFCSDHMQIVRMIVGLSSRATNESVGGKVRIFYEDIVGEKEGRGGR